jgi:hypothetical protein
MRRCVLTLALVAGLVAGPGSAVAATLNPIGKFELPIFVASAPHDPDRLLVAERKGRVIEVSAGATRQLADFSDLVSCCESERGLLSIAPAPDFDSSGRFYAAYTGTAAAGGDEGDVHLDSFRPQAAGPLVRDQVLSVAHALNPNHNGGQLQFGPDGHLYVSFGDGGGSGDPDGNAQNTETLLGKIVRIDPRPGQVPAYTVPPGNPFAAVPGRDEIWAYGLRNPWRFSFDRETAATVIADVGQDDREEIDFVSSAGGGIGGAGLNYGWNCREGFSAFPGAPGGCGSVGFADPVFDYPHEDPGGSALTGCSVIGGYVVRDPSVADLYGRYVYTDYCNSEIRSLVLPPGSAGLASGDRPEGLTVKSPTSFGEDSCGRVYLASGLGPVYRLEGATPATCPRPETVAVSFRETARNPRVRLSAERARHARFWFAARVAPCTGHAGAVLQLNRGGKRLRSRQLNGDCVARFRLHVVASATFRALLIDGSGARSRRLALRLARGGPRQRSQVRTIALAKPSP